MPRGIPLPPDVERAHNKKQLMMALIERREAAGLCVRCERPATGGRKTCDEHHLAQRSYSRKSKLRRQVAA